MYLFVVTDALISKFKGHLIFGLQETSNTMEFNVLVLLVPQLAPLISADYNKDKEGNSKDMVGIQQ